MATSLLLHPESLVIPNSKMCIISQDIFANHKNKSENWIEQNFPVFHSLVFHSIQGDIPWRQKLFLYHNGLDSLPVCECGKQTKFIDIVKGFRQFCSRLCQSNSKVIQSKKKETSISKYGCAHSFQSNEVKKKIIETNLRRYGVENVSMLDSVKQKVKSTNIAIYDVNYPSQISRVKEKFKQSMLNNQDFLISSRLQSLKKKISKKVSDFGLEFIGIISTSRYSLSCQYGHHFEIHKTMLNDRIRHKNIICTICNPINSFSGGQKELHDFVSEIYNGEIINNYRGKLGFELDIYLPEIGIALEYNGIYWHSSVYKGRTYHLSKFEKCEKIGITLIHIWEDDWLNEVEIVKMRLTDLICRREYSIDHMNQTSDLLITALLVRKGYEIKRKTSPVTEFIIGGRRSIPNFTPGKLHYRVVPRLMTLWNVGFFEFNSHLV